MRFILSVYRGGGGESATLKLAFLAVFLIINALTDYIVVSLTQNQHSLTHFATLGLLTRKAELQEELNGVWLYPPHIFNEKWRRTVMAGT